MTAFAGWFNPDRGVFVEASDVKEFGGDAGIVLGQVRFWLNKANKGKGGKNRWKVDRGGHTWIAHTHDMFAAETGLSNLQVKAAIRKLEKRGAIAKERHLHHAKNMTFIRLIGNAKFGEAAGDVTFEMFGDGGNGKSKLENIYGVDSFGED